MLEDMKIVAHILPFKTNNYIVEELIDWKNYSSDPIFRLVFPQKKMLLPNHFELIKKAIESGSQQLIDLTTRKIRFDLNPHPAGQKQYNIPCLNGEKLNGMQHKYRETVLFFPKKGQTCHAFCTFCFRWPQFVKLNDQKFMTKDIERLILYLQENATVTDVLFTGGDPMVMKAEYLEQLIRPLIESNISNLQTIRIGSKSLTYWPYRYVSDPDKDKILSLFSDVTDSEINLAFMAHFNHYQELKTDVVKQAIKNIRSTGTQIRTQSPILNYINASPKVWTKMWKIQAKMGMIPYYMFIVRDTGAQHYFSVPLIKAWKIFKNAYSKVSGICRTVRGPSMSCTPGKIEILGITTIETKKVFILRFIQGRNPNWIDRPFLAEYQPHAIWIDDLKPAFSKKFFFEYELKDYLGPYNEVKVDSEIEELHQSAHESINEEVTHFQY
jgi:L-lysine 2,3-aminomutase